MTKYNIYITATAERDIINASDHIEFVLKNPKAADDLLDKTEIKINSLSEFPEKFKLVDDPVLASWGVRFVVINGYLAFYIINEDIKLVTIIRFLFQKSNWSKILRQGFSLI